MARVRRPRAQHLEALLVLASFVSLSADVFVLPRRAILPCSLLGLGGVAQAVDDLGYEKQDGLKPGLGKKRTRLEGFEALPNGLQVWS